MLFESARFDAVRSRRNSFNSLPPVTLVSAIAALILLSYGEQSYAGGRERAVVERRVENLVHEFSGRLGITQQVVVIFSSENFRLASVESAQGQNAVYRVSFEPDFLLSLEEPELNAAVAHELGHLWIYTHFPFLQTELLANRQALRLVSCSDLERVYEKVWAWNGKKGKLPPVLDCSQDEDNHQTPR